MWVFATALSFLLLSVLSAQGGIGGLCNDLVLVTGGHGHAANTKINLKMEKGYFGEVQSYRRGDIYNVTIQVTDPLIQISNFVVTSSDEEGRYFLGNFSTPFPYNVKSIDECGVCNTVRMNVSQGTRQSHSIGWFIPPGVHSSSQCVLLRAKVITQSNTSIFVSKKLCEETFKVDFLNPKRRFRRNVEQPTSIASPTCANGWDQYVSSCYRVFYENETFEGAEEKCSMVNGSLVSINHQHESEFIDNLLQRNSSVVDSFWIGASDRLHEADFTWSDGSRVTYEDWFGGWPQYGYFGRQPNDDGLSHQDCVELRRKYAYPMKGYGLSDRWFWNDISCSSQNGFICQAPRRTTFSPDMHFDNCNVTVTASMGFITSPNYPNSYPDNVVCTTTIVVLPGHRIFLEFGDFVLESQTNCKYDYVRIRGSGNESQTHIFCGDYENKEKLLTTSSKTNYIEVTFISDNWINFKGFNASFYAQEVQYSCTDSTWFSIQGKCIKPVAAPQLDWEAAMFACDNTGHGNLASIENAELQDVISSKLIQSTSFSSTMFYWLAGTDRENEGTWKWQLGADMVAVTYTNWFEDSVNTSTQPSNGINEDCLLMTNSLSNKQTQQSYYWDDALCRVRAGYICQQQAKEVKLTSPYTREIVISDTEGTIQSPTYPKNYQNDTYIKWIFVVQAGYQIVLTLLDFDIEQQNDCLYDYLLFEESYRTFRHCGARTANTFHYNTMDNILNLTFSSDYSITSRGFSLCYVVVPLCQNTVFTTTEGSLQSDSIFGHYLNGVDCLMNISVPVDKRVVLEFEMFDVTHDSNCKNDFVEIYLSSSSKYSERICGNKTLELWKLKYVSYTNTMLIIFRTDHSETGKGFRAKYTSVSISGRVNSYAEVLPNVTSTTLTSLDYPNPFPALTSQETTFVAPTGFHATLNFTAFDFGRSETTLCSTDVVVIIDYERYGYERTLATICGGLKTDLNLSYVSTYHKIVIRVTSGSSKEPLNAGVNATFRIMKSNEVWDPGILDPPVKTTHCDSRPCKNGATCSLSDTAYSCTCTDEFTGIHCSEQRASYLLSEPLWTGTLTIVGLLILIPIFVKLKRRCETVWQCGLKKDLESPFKTVEEEAPSDIYAKYADNDPTADAFSTLIQKLKSGAMSQGSTSAKGLSVPNGALVAKDPLSPNGILPKNKSGQLQVVAVINQSNTSKPKNATSNLISSQGMMHMESSFSNIIFNNDIDIIHEEEI